MLLGRRLSDSGGGSRCNNRRSSGSSSGIAVHLSLGAVPGDVASLAATVASLAGSVERAAVGSSAIAGDVSYKSQS